MGRFAVEVTLPKPKARLLLVDDNPANLLALEAVLASPEYEIQSIESGAEAVELCHKTEFTLIIMDIQMPKMDGYEAAKHIKETVLNSNTPIIFVSAIYREEPHVAKGFDIGAVDFFGKPFNPDILKKKVSIYTDLYLKSKQLRETEEFLQTHGQLKMLLEALPVGVIIADAKGKLYEFNGEAERIWGGFKSVGLEQYGEFQGWWADSGKNLAAEDWAIARALAKGESSNNEIIRIRAFDGAEKTISNSAYPIRDSHGSILGAVAVIQDVSGINALASDIQQKTFALLKDVQMLNKQNGPFVA